MNAEITELNNGWKKITLENDTGMRLELLNYGGVVTRLDVPDRYGKSSNIVLAFAEMDDYLVNDAYFGALVGRVAGRIKNASFHIAGKQVILAANEGPHHLHGGPDGLHQERFEPEIFQNEDEAGVILRGSSDNRFNGYPGSVQIAVTYTLKNDNTWQLSYKALTDEMTPLTLTNHSYFNLTGDFTCKVGEHTVHMESDGFLELDEELIPTGFIDSAQDGPFDFKGGRTVQSGFSGGNSQNEVVGGGYDHYFLLKAGSKESVRVAEPTSGRVMTVETTQPGVVFYTGNSLSERFVLSDGNRAHKYAGFCLETQGSPASLHHKGLPPIWLKPGQVYDHHTIYRFTVE